MMSQYASLRKMAPNVNPTGQGHRQAVGRGIFERERLKKAQGGCGVNFFFNRNWNKVQCDKNLVSKRDMGIWLL